MAFKGKSVIIIVVAFFGLLAPSRALTESSTAPPAYWPTHG